MEQLQSATHPKTKEIYFVGDRVCIYQGRFGHNNIITIKSIWKGNNHIYVSKNDTLPGTYLDAVKHKISDKEYYKILKAKHLASKYT